MSALLERRAREHHQQELEPILTLWRVVFRYLAIAALSFSGPLD